jgi:hypothetical protein
VDKEEEKAVVEDGGWGSGGDSSHKITQTELLLFILHLV